MHGEVGEAVSDMKENARILSLIMLDPQCRSMMQDFAEQYGDALIGPEKLRFLSRHGVDILLMAVAGLGAGIIYLKNAARISAWLKKAAKLIEQGRLANAAKFKGLKVKEKHTLQQPKKKTASYSKVELDSHGKFRGEHNAGPNAPTYQKWTESGGTIKYDSATDTILYGKKLKTARDEEFIEVPYKKGPPDNQRYPDFSKYSEQEVKIKMSGKPEKDIAPPDRGDFSKAWEALEKNKGSDEVAKYGIEKRTKGKRIGTYPDRNPENMTWHHVQDGETMQLLDSDIHSSFKHKGGASYSR